MSLLETTAGGQGRTPCPSPSVSSAPGYAPARARRLGWQDRYFPRRLDLKLDGDFLRALCVVNVPLASEGAEESADVPQVAELKARVTKGLLLYNAENEAETGEGHERAESEKGRLAIGAEHLALKDNGLPSLLDVKVVGLEVGHHLPCNLLDGLGSLLLRPGKLVHLALNLGLRRTRHLGNNAREGEDEQAKRRVVAGGCVDDSSASAMAGRGMMAHACARDDCARRS
eukprot:CAMPEP_0185161646 /NCGR_PEP_ID=MMETSP1139-20130426/5302_1 /TAXON_ID=298111 /ORGANISM="Pavlova sp., Strain CCMP459" /LENGTH=228 /DNA_ID=CAMNT_0027726923 /DNA_START=353 /DNA_END=1041 /DNA_ORIENTATION=+